MTTISHLAQNVNEQFDHYDAKLRRLICSNRPSRATCCTKLFLITTAPIAYPLFRTAVFLSRSYLWVFPPQNDEYKSDAYTNEQLLQNQLLLLTKLNPRSST